VGFEPGMQGSPDLCASALTTAPRGRLDVDNLKYEYISYKYLLHMLLQQQILSNFICCLYLWFLKRNRRKQTESDLVIEDVKNNVF
jgi:hypothetical protein